MTGDDDGNSINGREDLVTREDNVEDSDGAAGLSNEQNGMLFKNLMVLVSFFLPSRLLNHFF